MNRTPSGLLVPGSASGLQIHVPRGYEHEDQEGEEKPAFVCRVTVGPGQTCGKLFYGHERAAWESHMGRCAREHIDQVVAQSPRSRLPIFNDPELGDPEIEEHMRGVGRRMLEEGRWVMRPSERAGF